MSGFTIAWIVWSLIGIFIEAVALAGRRRPNDTLSENIQSVVLRNGKTRAVGILVWAAFAVWFAFHIFA